MKPAAFEYAAARSVEEALELMAGEDAAALAGGQSLVPLMNLRLARPARVVDLNGVGELSYLRVQDGALRIGALARQAVVERSPAVVRGWPLLAQALRFVGHLATRTRGTVGGSVAHADPRAELPVALPALGARFHVRGPGGAERVVPAADMFRGAMTTALREGELLCEIEVPPVWPGAQTAFVEHARTHGDFALAGVAAVVVPGERAAVTLLGAGPAPVRDVEVERAVAAGAGARGRGRPRGRPRPWRARWRIRSGGRC